VGVEEMEEEVVEQVVEDLENQKHQELRGQLLH